MSGKQMVYANPFKPGAGRSPPFLAGREHEKKEFAHFLEQETITQNIVLTGLRGVGKTVLMDDAYRPMDCNYLIEFFNSPPGLNSDKLKSTLELAWRGVEAVGKQGIVFAYDEAQVVQDQKRKDQYPLAMLLETFQSIQRKGMRAMLL